MNRSLVKLEFQKSSLHTIVYGGGGTGTGKTCFVRQYINLYQKPNARRRSKTYNPSM